MIPDNQAHKELLLNALLKEWKLRLPQVLNYEVVSIYFGGGTPSLFGHQAIHKLVNTIRQDAQVAPDCEITLEANPEDITLDLMTGYAHAGINRVSIGVQSLVDASLQVLERTHSAKRAISAINQTAQAGIKNITIDLMYELPDQTQESFEKTLDQLDRLPISHLSLYNLTIEPHTAFSKRKLKLPPEEAGLSMLQAATKRFEEIGLYRYEISAFAKPGFESRHNVGYWTARPFFGLGPSAFSYYEGARFRNIAHLHKYCRSLENGQFPVDFSEKLPYPQNVHELLSVELRLLKGVKLSNFNLPSETLTTIDKLIKNGYLDREGKQIKLSEKGVLFYDTVASDLI